jgi:gamma-glutamylcyclotransferase (GGCT)/AIG2-like uncharacterized protein YtfP
LTQSTTYLPFFVYGTLLPGEINFPLWREAIQEFKPATLPGACLYDLGRFPILVEGDKGEVRGMAGWVRPSSYGAALSLLDLLEGVRYSYPVGFGYRRTARVVQLAGGSSVAAWVYVGNPEAVAGLALVGSDWKAYRRGDVKSW